MKILKYVFYLILALVLIFLAIGLFNPSVSYGHSITADKPLKEAWAAAQDDSKFGQWLEGFKSIEHLTGEKGEVGSTYKVIVKPEEEAEQFEMIETIQSKKDFDHVTLHFESDFGQFDQTISYEVVNGKTKVSTDSKVTGTNIITRSMFAAMEMFTGAFTTQEAKNIEALKKVIEENTTDYYPVPVITEDVIMEEEVVE